MKQLLLCASIICFCSFSVFGQSQRTEWNDVTYFSYTNFKMRVTTFEKPLVLEWGKLPDSISSEEKRQKLKAVSVGTYFHNLDVNHEEWKTYCTEEYINALEMDQKKFKKKKNFDLKGEFPSRRFLHVFYWIDYLIDGKQYCMVVESYDKKQIEKLPDPEHMREYHNEHPLTATILMKKNGQWRNHDLKGRPYPWFYDYVELGKLLKIEKVGFAIDGVKSRDFDAVKPSEELRKAVGRGAGNPDKEKPSQEKSPHQ